jgi:hypothetical protein
MGKETSAPLPLLERVVCTPDKLITNLLFKGQGIAT